MCPLPFQRFGVRGNAKRPHSCFPTFLPIAVDSVYVSWFYALRTIPECLQHTLVNVAVVAFPIEVLPRLYHYGYAAPFYNVSKAARIILFGNKNRGEFRANLVRFFGGSFTD